MRYYITENSTSIIASKHQLRCFTFYMVFNIPRMRLFLHYKNKHYFINALYYYYYFIQTCCLFPSSMASPRWRFPSWLFWHPFSPLSAHRFFCDVLCNTTHSRTKRWHKSPCLPTCNAIKGLSILQSTVNKFLTRVILLTFLSILLTTIFYVWN